MQDPRRDRSASGAEWGSTLERLREIGTPSDRARIWQHLYEWAKAPRRSAVLHEAIRLANRVSNPRIRARRFARLARFAPRAEQPRLIRLALRAASHLRQRGSIASIHALLLPMTSGALRRKLANSILESHPMILCGIIDELPDAAELCDPQLVEKAMRGACRQRLGDRTGPARENPHEACCTCAPQPEKGGAIRCARDP